MQCLYAFHRHKSASHILRRQAPEYHSPQRAGQALSVRFQRGPRRWGSNTFRMGVVGLSKTLSQELGKDGILVNVIGPGRIGTARIDQMDQVRAEKAVKQWRRYGSRHLRVSRWAAMGSRKSTANWLPFCWRLPTLILRDRPFWWMVGWLRRSDAYPSG